MKTETVSENAKKVSRHELIELLNQDLAREYQAIIGYVVYSQVLKGAEFMNIASELEKHAAQELSHALIIAKQIDYLGGMPAVEPKAVRTSGKAISLWRRLWARACRLRAPHKRNDREFISGARFKMILLTN